MTLTALVIALLGAGEVSLVVAPGVTCVEQARLVPRLEAAGLRLINPPSGRLAVTVGLERQQVMVRATRQGAPFERAMPAQADDCDAIERVLAALIASWSQQLPAVEPRPPVLLVKKVKVPEPTLSEPPVELAPVLVEAPEEEPEPPLPPPERKPLPVGVAPPEVVAAVPPPTQPSSLPFTLDVAALGGGSLGPTETVSGVGQLQLGISFGRVGALLEGGLDSTRSASIFSTRIESSTQWLSLSGRVRFAPGARVRLDLALGFRLWRIAARSFNAIEPKSLELLGLGGVLSAGASYQLAGPLSLHLRAFTSLRSSRQRFFIGGVGPVMELDPWEGGLLLGLELGAFAG